MPTNAFATAGALEIAASILDFKSAPVAMDTARQINAKRLIKTAIVGQRRYTLGVNTRAAMAFSVLALSLCAQDAPRTKASDYPRHITLPSLEIGAEYLVHTVPGPKGGYFAGDYLVVEVAIFPGATNTVSISSGQFTLRINNKTTLVTQASGAVAASIKYPDWEQHRNISAQAGPLIFGPSGAGRFPGDPTQPRPLPSPVPDQTDTAGVKQPDLPIETAIAQAALPEGLISEQVKGCLFFRFEGKLKSIKSLDLIFDQAGASSVRIPLL